jgi:hypothetical protein
MRFKYVCLQYGKVILTIETQTPLDEDQIGAMVNVHGTVTVGYYDVLVHDNQDREPEYPVDTWILVR